MSNKYHTEGGRKVYLVSLPDVEGVTGDAMQAYVLEQLRSPDLSRELGDPMLALDISKVAVRPWLSREQIEKTRKPK